MVLPGMALLAVLAGQMIDGHVHKVQNGGLLVHCGGKVVEIVVRRRGEVVEGVPVVDVEGWLFSEKDAWLAPDGRTLRLREIRRRTEVTLQPARDHFEGKLPIASEDGTVPIELELSDRGRISRARLTWTNLDERERIDDGRISRPPGIAPQRRAPPPRPRRRPERDPAPPPSP
jgi:hypothetical protein